MAQDAKAKVAPTVPNLAPGFGMTELLKHLTLTVRSDQVDYTDTTAVNLIEVPANALITNVQIKVSTAFDASGTSAAATGTISIPQDTGALVVWDAANTLLQSAGLHSASVLNALVAASGGFVIFDYTAATTTVGALEVYLSYVPDLSKLV